MSDLAEVEEAASTHAAADVATLAARVEAAISARTALLASLAAEGTDIARLFHGVVEGWPGLTVDRYGPVLLVQTFREPLPPGALDAIVAACAPAFDAPPVPVWNHRGPGDGGSAWDPRLEAPIGHELGLAYDVRPRHRGRDPLLFVDFRAARRWVRAEAAGRSVLNLFAYTCGVGVAALAGGASEVWNVDFARSALAVGRENAARNGLPAERFHTLEDEVWPIVRQLAGLDVKGRGARRGYTRVAPRAFDLVVLDPPRWAKGTFGAVDVVRDYPSLFKPALLAAARGGRVLATNHVPSVDVEAWKASLLRTAEKAGRPLAGFSLLAPEADVPSADGRHPLKIAIAELA